MQYDTKYWILVFSIILAAYITSTVIRKILSKIIERKSSGIKTDPTKFVFLKNSVSFIIYTIATIAVFMITPALSDVGKGLFASAGIIAATIGFASQKVFSNILSGIFILFFKPFSVHDIIELRSDNLKGVVEEITLRHTIIRDYENRRIVIPNSTISENTLINSTIADEKIRKHIEIGISYDSDIDKAKQIMVEEIQKHPNFLDVRSKEDKANGVPAVITRVVALADFSVNIKAYVWAENNDRAWELYCDSLENIKKRFDREGIEIPFPYRTLVFKNQPEIKIPNNDNSINNK